VFTSQLSSNGFPIGLKEQVVCAFEVEFTTLDVASPLQKFRCPLWVFPAKIPAPLGHFLVLLAFGTFGTLDKKF